MKDSRDVKIGTEIKEVKGRRGGAVKKAPNGYYTAKEAQNKLGLNASTFGYYVRKGKIKKTVPPLRTEGFYEKEEIDQLAREVALFLHTEETPVKFSKTRVAEQKDIQGIADVLTSMGWRTTTVEQRSSWYKINPLMDYIVEWNNQIMGYIWGVPLGAETLEAMMSGKKRAWDIKKEDIIPYTPGESYDIYTGIATRQDTRDHTRFAFRLIAGYISFLEELAHKGIYLNRIYAVSAEPNGQKLSKALGFTPLEAKEGDMFPRFVLDLKKSDSHFAKQYREIVKEAKSTNSHTNDQNRSSI